MSVGGYDEKIIFIGNGLDDFNDAGIGVGSLTRVENADAMIGQSIWKFGIGGAIEDDAQL